MSTIRGVIAAIAAAVRSQGRPVRSTVDAERGAGDHREVALGETAGLTQCYLNPA